MSKKNGNGGPTSVLADLVEAVGDLRAEQATQADAVSALSNHMKTLSDRMLEIADLIALHAREFRESSRRMDERLAKFARTLITFTGTALERG